MTTERLSDTDNLAVQRATGVIAAAAGKTAKSVSFESEIDPAANNSRQRYFRGSASRPSMALAATVAGLPRKMRASREPMRPW